MHELSKTSAKNGVTRLRTGSLLLVLFSIVMNVSCTTAPPVNVEDICKIFDEKRSWYKAAKKSEQRWGTPKHIQLSIIHQESSFKFNARPPRTKLFGFIPWKRPSNAYGYAQALDSTWEWYKNDSGRRFADRDNFDDAIDFVGWYTNMSNESVGISKWDPYNQYLAYHEGHTGWRRKTYQQKDWLKKAARQVDYRSKEWNVQLQHCEDDLDEDWWMIF